MITRLSLRGLRTLMKQGVMPEMVESGTRFLMVWVPIAVELVSFGDSKGIFVTVIRATLILAPGGFETMYSACCFPVMIVAQLNIPSVTTIKTGIMIFVRTNWRVDLL